ncbi:MAG: GAF domain-containing sensor histidine kinase [Anaerolineae bacterium]|uniref:GAF domain-containing sensor histidine kinase n=1 Tax=Thermoflexus sp. TaxID=1969742 RepID=UPI0025EFFC93|nr:GAF domain-containing sensor histidine kinase [Thermoflexus sp.]MCS7350750.1 sensor histidine kinase [Thermoflexus sp.]MDW8180201.1 GAF domain-containing sensor histidine kinase [Anaerolineae bacterium]
METRPASSAPTDSAQMEWILGNLRWLLIVAMALTAALNPGSWQASEAAFIALLLLTGLYNLLVLLALVFVRSRLPLPAITLAGDVLITLSFIAITGGLSSPLFFFAFLPILTAALRIGWWAGELVTFGLMGGLILWEGIQGRGDLVLPSFLVQASVLALGALLTGTVGDRLKREILRELQERELIQRRLLAQTRQQLQGLFELAAALGQMRRTEEILHAALEVSEGLFRGSVHPAPPMFIALLDPEGLRVAAARRLPPRDERARLPGLEGAIREALERGEATLCSHPTQDPELGRLVVMRIAQAALVLPLGIGLDRYGVLVIAGPDPQVFTSERQDLLRLIATQASIALQNALLYHTLQREKERLVEVEEEARRRLARELHDGPTQSVAALAMRLNFLQKLFQHDPAQLPSELAKAEQMARQAVQELRQFLFRLRPLILESQGLVAALTHLAERLQEIEPFAIHVEVDPAVDQKLDPNAKGLVFSIVEEAVNNARKHAEPQNVWIRMRIEGDQLQVSVEDDGVGFDPQALRADYGRRGSMGMLSMMERAGLLRGEFWVESAPGQGTRVRLQIPLPNAAPDAEPSPREEAR